MNPSTLRSPSLLDVFPPDVRGALAREEQSVETHVVLVKSADKSKWVYFPHRGCVVSLTRTAETGATVEVGIIGSDGMVGIDTLLSMEPARSDAVVQVSGRLSRAKAADVRRVFDENREVRQVLLTASMKFLHQVSQHAVCNRLHSVEQRLAKWLLEVRDKVDSDEIRLTHDFLSHMLGIRRSGVTVAIGALEQNGLITHRRSSLTIVDRAGLEDSACECYAVTR
jgi:CRP-like cAMP-binding protein